LDFSVDTDAGESAGIVRGKFMIRLLDRKLVSAWVDCDHRCIGASFDSDGFAAACIANDVIDLVVACLGSLGSGHGDNPCQSRFVFRDE
jgi:hypothetical protein